MLFAAPAFVELTPELRTLWCETNRLLVATGASPVPLEGDGLIVTPAQFTAFLAGVDQVAAFISTQLLEAFAPLATAQQVMWKTFAKFVEQRQALAAEDGLWSAVGLSPVWPEHLSVIFFIAADMLGLPPREPDNVCVPFTASIAGFWPPEEGKAAWRATHRPSRPHPAFFATRAGKTAAVVGALGLCGLVTWVLRPRTTV